MRFEERPRPHDPNGTDATTGARFEFNQEQSDPLRSDPAVPIAWCHGLSAFPGLLN